MLTILVCNHTFKQVRENSLEHQVSEYQQEKDSIQSQLETVQVENKKLKDGLHDRDVAKVCGECKD